MRKYLKYLALIALIGIANVGYTQDIYKIQDSKDNSMKLKGTSTFHDWEMDAQTISGEARFNFNSSRTNELTSIKSLYFVLQVKDLKSDNSGLNENAYNALKSNKHKDIRYNLTSSILSLEKGRYLIKSKGNLTIAGVTKDIRMDVYGIINNDGSISFNGSYKFNMTDYNVEPPSFMLGAMKTGDTISLDFKVKYIK